MIKNVTEGIAAWLAGTLLVALIFSALLSLPGCQNETSVSRWAHRMVNGYCALAPQKREQVRKRFNKKSPHQARIVCAGEK